MNVSNSYPPETTVTSKGQVTIPSEIREHLGIKPKDRVRFSVDPSGAVRVTAAPSRLLEGFGAVAPRQKPENYRAVRVAFEKGVAAGVQRQR
jgi:AbrB family looped-hinge helix DNA binding protein